MSKAPEELAREEIDEMLIHAGWDVQDLHAANIHARQGVAIREFPLTPGHGFSDYMLYVDGKAAGVIEAGRDGKPSEEDIKNAAEKLIGRAVKPLYNPDLRNLLIELKKKDEQIIDHVSQDQIIEAGFSAEALEKAKGMVDSFKKFIQDNRDEITGC